ncbi:hypothetical protein [Sphingobacterium bambusae]|uniref:Uncharacterized protein n=1 Tax=Sphingobacterium bambusae TaxID=662858 RepID=A0ABW6BES2_9SPHI|nr:hypothetical protein [Sphingobacterium bambusae]WPL48611.1 hypothetical protein SCB77_21925 [Sphingobacterium bambusae]
MRQTLNVHVNKDFLLTCEALQIDLSDAVQCYVDRVKLLETVTDERKTETHTASKIFFCYYLPKCRAQERPLHEGNVRQICAAIEDLQLLQQGQEIDPQSAMYQDFIDQLFNKLTLDYGTTKDKH